MYPLAPLIAIFMILNDLYFINKHTTYLVKHYICSFNIIMDHGRQLFGKKYEQYQARKTSGTRTSHNTKTLHKTRRVFITGGAEGIGKAIVRTFRGAGHRVAFCDKTKHQEKRPRYKPELSSFPWTLAIRPHWRIACKRSSRNGAISILSSITRVSASSHPSRKRV